MVALIVGLFATALGTLAHIVLLRRLSGSLLFTSVPVLLLITLAFVGLGYNAGVSTLGMMDAFLALTLSMSLGLCYVLLLVGVIYDSPTLALTNAISDYGPAGMPTTDMAKVAQRHPFVASRLAALVTSGQIAVEGNDFIARQRTTSVLIRLGKIYRHLRGADSPAG
jgi:hypothetical protein